MFGLKLANVFNENPLLQLQMIARRKPSLIFGVMGASLAMSFGLPELGFSLGTVPNLLLNGASALGAFSLMNEYARILHFYKKPTIEKPRFKEQEIRIDNNLVAELNYVDGLPVCTLHTTDPYLAGRGVALLMPGQIIETLDRFYELLPSTMQLLHLGTSSFKWDIDKFIESEIKHLKPKIPDHIQKHIEGLVMEMQQWVEKDNKRWVYQRPIPTVEDLTKFILIPDICKMLGCSAVIKRDGKNSEIWRNLDWPSLGVIHQQSMLLITKLKQLSADKPTATASVTFTPGIAGLSLTNDKGLTLTINEATTMRTKRHNHGGTPEILHTREIVRNCTTLKEVEEFLLSSKPLTSHILTVMDASGQGAIFQILPPKSEAPFTKRALEETDEHIKVTNHHINVKGDVIDGSVSWPDSMKRFAQLEDALDKELRGFKTLRNAQQRATTHSVIFTNRHNSEGSLVQEVRLRAHNAFSASIEVPFKHVNVSDAFNKLGK